MALKNNFYNQNFGRQGEDIATQFVQEQGYVILSRNFRTKLGEIDLIAEKSGEIFFFEVKSRTSNSYGVPSEIINLPKLKRMEQIAWLYLRSINRENTDWSIKIIEYTNKECTIHDVIL